MIEVDHFDAQQQLHEQRTLFALCFPEAINQPALTINYYQWKFHHYPLTPSSYEYGSYQNQKLVGYYAAIPYQYKIGDSIMRCGMVCDVMTDPALRGKGLFLQLGLHATEQLKMNGVDFCSGYPIRPEVIPGHLKAGWHIAFSLPMYIKPLKANHLLAEKKLAWLTTPIANVFLSLYQRLLQPIQSTLQSIHYKFFTEEQIEHIVGYERFFQEWSQNIPHALIKDQAFLQWRFRFPKAHYHFICAYDDQEQLLGISIVRITTIKNIPALAVLDLMIKNGPQYQAAVRSMQKQITKCAVSHNAEVIVLMLSQYWAKKYRLIRYGFLKSPFVFKLIIKQLSERCKNIIGFNEEKNWHLMWIDSDDL